MLGVKERSNPSNDFLKEARSTHGGGAFRRLFWLDSHGKGGDSSRLPHIP